MRYFLSAMLLFFQFLYPSPILAFGGLSQEKSTAMFIGFFLFYTLGAFIFAGARGGGIMVAAFCILLIVFGILEGGIRVNLSGIPLELAIGIIASIIAGIILMVLQGR